MIPFFGKVWNSLFGIFFRCDVFISYATPNKDEALLIKKILKGNFANVFMAPHSIQPGRDWYEEIKSNIDSADLVIPIISSKTNKSAFTNQEIGYAINKKNQIIPIMVGKISNKNLGFLSNLQYQKIENRKQLKKNLFKKVFEVYAKQAAVWLILGLILIFNK